jgi:hypothetical protein
LDEPTPLQTNIVSTTNYNGYDISCAHYSDGGIDLSVSGSVPIGTGSNAYTYLWNNTWTTQDIYGIMSGIYSVLITDANACTTSTSITLTEPTPLQTNIISTTNYNGYDISCTGYTDGGIDLSVSGSVPTYNYVWSNGAIVEDLSNIAFGNYNVFITDANACTTSTSITLSEPTPLVSNYIVSNINGYSVCFGGNDGSIDLTVSGSVPNTSIPYYSYQWSNGMQTEDIYNLTAGI